MFALNPYDYETRFGDGIRRGNQFANIIIGGLQILSLAQLAQPSKTASFWEQLWEAAMRTLKIPPDLLTEFDAVARLPHYKHAARKVLQKWRSWPKARERYSLIKAPVTLVYGDKDWSRPSERERTRAALDDARTVILPDTGHFSSVENRKGWRAPPCRDHAQT